MFLLILCASWLTAQVPVSIMKEVDGVVFDARTKQPLDNVILQIPDLRLYQITDKYGAFQFKLPANTSTLVYISLLGYQTKELHIDTLRSNLRIGVGLSQLSLKLDEVTVTATRGQDLSTSSLINNEAIQYLQATDLSDLMQLLPGAVTKNPSLNDVSLLNIRGANKIDATNALGTAVYVDGMQLSNNANMQRLSQQNGFYMGNANSGIDVRAISPENIESVEVIRGVPSVRYANMTSGAVLVKTKTGQMPYLVNVKVTPNVKTLSAGKGWKLGANAGYLNLSGDAGLSYIDMRTKDDAFKKLGAQAAYSNVFAKESTPFSLNVRLRYVYAKDKADKSTDKIRGEYNEATNQRWSGSVFGTWDLKKKLITTLDYSASFQCESQLFKESVWHSTNQMASSNTLSSGEYLGYFTPPQYMSLLTVNGKPFTSTLSVSGSKMISSLKFSNKITLGGDVNYEGNNGRGQEFDPLLPPSPNMRPLSYGHLSNL
ncbi:MAG: TonB-dependent receptor, partial [Tannerellaceae bacterium]